MILRQPHALTTVMKDDEHSSSDFFLVTVKKMKFFIFSIDLAGFHD